MLKQSTFITVFICTHLIFIFSYVYQYSRYMQLTFTLREHETTKLALLQKKQELTHQLYALQDRSKIKQFAVTELKLEPLSLTQIKRIDKNEYSKSV